VNEVYNFDIKSQPSIQLSFHPGYHEGAHYNSVVVRDVAEKERAGKPDGKPDADIVKPEKLTVCDIAGFMEAHLKRTRAEKAKEGGAGVSGRSPAQKKMNAMDIFGKSG
jgi:hypothetical protein